MGRVYPTEDLEKNVAKNGIDVSPDGDWEEGIRLAKEIERENKRRLDENISKNGLGEDVWYWLKFKNLRDAYKKGDEEGVRKGIVSFKSEKGNEKIKGFGEAKQLLVKAYMVVIELERGENKRKGNSYLEKICGDIYQKALELYAKKESGEELKKASYFLEEEELEKEELKIEKEKLYLKEAIELIEGFYEQRNKKRKKEGIKKEKERLVESIEEMWE